MPLATTTARRLPRLLALSTAGLLAASAGGAVAHDRAGGDTKDVRGVVRAVDSPRFTIDTRRGATMTIGTDGDTRFLLTTPATIDDAVPGVYLGASGKPAADGSLAAVRVHIVPGPRPAPPETERGENKSGGRAAPNREGHVFGEVVRRDGSTLLVHTRSGDDRVVTTSERTRFVRTAPGAFSDIAVGRPVHANVRRADGGIYASRVHFYAAPDRPAKPAAPAAPATAAAPAANPKPAPPAAAADTSVRSVAVSPVPPARDPAGPRRPEARASIDGWVADLAEPNFTMKSRQGAVTVVTSSETAFMRTVDASLDDAAVGTTVTAFGRRVEGMMAADFIHIRPSFPDGDRPHDGRGAISGRVTANHPESRSITVETPDGPVVVRAHDGTRIVRTYAASFADLARGQAVTVNGEWTATGQLAARGVHIREAGDERTAYDGKAR